MTCFLRFIITLTVGTVVLGAAHQAVAAKPNILIIVADDAEMQDLGSYGGDIDTPNLDRLAREGARFTNVYPTSTVCTPSRYTLLTGKYPTDAASVAGRTPVGEPASITWNTFISDADRGLGDMAGGLGYQTGFVGKWHVGMPMQWHVAPRSWPGDPDYMRQMSLNMEIRAKHVEKHAGFDGARAVYDNNVLAMPVSHRLMGHHQTWLTHETLKLFDEFDRDGKPWLLYHASTLPHPPDILESLEMDPRATLAGYSEEHVGALPDHAELRRRVEAHGPFEDEGRRSEVAGIIWLDASVGRMLNDLESRGVLDDTVIVFVSDHDRRGKFVLNGGRVPMLVRYPKRVEAGTEVDALVSLADLVPTLLDFAGGDAAETESQLPGVSLVPLLTGEATSVRDSAYMEVTYTRAVVTDRFKYIATRFPDRIADSLTPDLRRRTNQEGLSASFGDPDGDVVRYRKDRLFPGYFDDDQLYDLHADPGEQVNLARDPEFAETLDHMKSLLREHSRDNPFPFGEFSDGRSTTRTP